MFENLQVFKIAHAMAVHAGKRQSVIAANMANADTPGYRARDVAPFSVSEGTDASEFSPRATRQTCQSASSSLCGRTGCARGASFRRN